MIDNDRISSTIFLITPISSTIMMPILIADLNPHKTDNENANS
jgi:hypothetical protein